MHKKSYFFVLLGFLTNKTLFFFGGGGNFVLLRECTLLFISASNGKEIILKQIFIQHLQKLTYANKSHT